MTDDDGIHIEKTTAAQLAEALRNEAIRAQNDAFRRMALQDDSVGRWVLTQAIHAEGPEFVNECVAKVRAYDGFDEDIDPHGDHSMGKIEVQGKKVWFKIDLYNADYTAGSEAPDEVTKTRRVLTIMFPSDY